MNWDELEEGDALLSETGDLVWLAVEKAGPTLKCVDLHDASVTPVERSAHPVNPSFTVVRGEATRPRSTGPTGERGETPGRAPSKYAKDTRLFGRMSLTFFARYEDGP